MTNTTKASGTWLIVTLLFASTMTVMSGAIIAPALPEMSLFFEGQAKDVFIKLILTMPAIGIVIFSAVMGSLADKYGRKKVMLGCLLIFGISGTAGLYVSDLYVLLFTRFILGVSVAGIMTSATAMIGDYFEGSQRRKFLGLQASFMAIGGIVYLNLGGFLSDISWRGPYAVYTLGLVILILAHFNLPRIPSENKSDDESPAELGNSSKKLIYVVFLLSFLGMTLFYMTPVQIPFLLTGEFEVSNTMV